jgi:hypothetical protein
MNFLCQAGTGGGNDNEGGQGNCVMQQEDDDYSWVSGMGYAPGGGPPPVQGREGLRGQCQGSHSRWEGGEGIGGVHCGAYPPGGYIGGFKDWDL